MPAQDKPRRAALRHDASAYVPTEEGTNWIYRKTSTDREVPGAPGEARIGKGLFGTYLRPDGSRWHLVAVHDGSGGGRYEHWNTEGPGLLVQATPTAIELAEVQSSCPLAAPVGAVNRWEWEVKAKDETVVHRASLVAFDERITVPAGTFRAVHVRVFAFDEQREPTATEDSWFARDIGLVRLERNAGTLREVTELLTFTRGRDQTQERLATLQMLAPPAWLWTKHGAAAIRWLDQDAGSVAFGGRFALVGDGAELQVAFVKPGTFAPLPAAGAAAWQEVVRGGSRADRNLIAATAARLHAARLRLVDVQVDYEDQGRMTLRGADPSGTRTFQINVTTMRGLGVEIAEQIAKR